MANKVYKPKNLTSGDLAQIINLGKSMLFLTEYTKKKDGTLNGTGNTFTIVSQGTSYQVFNPSGSHIANIKLDHLKGLQYVTKLNGTKDNANGLKWKASFYDSLKAIYDGCIKEIRKSCGIGADSKEYLARKVQNNSWIALMVAYKVNSFICQDPETANGFENALTGMLSEKDWIKAWEMVIHDLVENSNTSFATNVANALTELSGNDSKQLQYLACLPTDVIQDFGKRLLEVSYINEDQESNLKTILLDDEDVVNVNDPDSIEDEGIEEKCSNPTEYDPNEWGEIPSGQEVPPDFIGEEE